MVQDIVVLLVVAAAAAYTILRLYRMAAGRSQCACGSKACGSRSAPCGVALKGATAIGESGGASGGLPLLPPSCNQGGCPRNR